ncbi:MAG TPA: hypothetical protein VEC12_09335, partial [Bacteroidia bacterium]|nr:hypothetical protein [Bacteroidia bacterium]
MNKIWQAVGIVLALNIALLGFSWLYEHTFVQWDDTTKQETEGDFRFITLSDILTPDTSTINETAEQLADKLLKADTLVIKKMPKRGKVDSAFLVKNSDTAALRENKIYNPGGLAAFFEALIQEKDNTLIRVGHYGDSQLEGDRVTQNLRVNLQAKFGGGGLGFVPLDDVASSMGYTRTHTGTWTRYNVFNNRIKNGFYGLSGTLFRFAKGEVLPDSIKAEDSASLGAYTETGKSGEKKVKYGRNASVTFNFAKWVSYDRVSLMYGRTSEGFVVKGTSQGKPLFTDSVKPSLGFAQMNLDIPDGTKNFKLEFLCNSSPDIYGLQVDGSTGITVDNYAIRGHSGDGLMKIDDAYLATQADLTNTRLIVFQYGANMIPYLESEKECQYYEDAFYRLFMKFKKAAPKASILVIGNGDMGTHVAGQEQSYAHVRCLSDVQKSAALRAGCSFWSLLDAMGGDNSILTWSRKGLSSLDGHLS